MVGCFNKCAQRLLERHLSSGFRKCLILLKERIQGNHIALVQEGRELVTYAIINAIAMRKILKKYDKVFSFWAINSTHLLSHFVSFINYLCLSVGSLF